MSKVTILCPEHEIPLEIEYKETGQLYGYCEFCDKDYPVDRLIYERLMNLEK